MATSREQAKQEQQLPPPDGDFYGLVGTLSQEDRDLVSQVRTFMEEKVAPIINDYWMRDEFPFEVLPAMSDLSIAGLAYEGYGCPGKGTLLDGFVTMELSRVDPSMATFQGVHSGLAMGSIYLCGSEEQRQKWLPQMARMEKIGAFGLTEPEIGSGVAGGLTATARREGDEWVLNGQKKWIGNATFADVTVVWARDLADDTVKGFLVEKGTPGFTAEKMENKMALRAVQNALITLDECRVKEEDRLQNANSFKDTAKVLRMTRVGVAWIAVGCGMGAYEHALAYAQQREQFGRPIGGFQLIQDLLVQMLGNVTASQCMMLRLSQMQDAGEMKAEHASLAKAFATTRTRETVALAREALGGNGVLINYDVGRFFADAEAIHSYEGTRQINSLIVGRAITGFGAFL
ncbi:MAG TPA: acyl-CoA dehydrogenase family protein [Rubrobacteraceae bacterium]|nr:acyl-CoA dehydrogenase family protein [Rubrobacteraceae bacterium]